jgi:hypothetical protein
VGRQESALKNCRQAICLTLAVISHHKMRFLLTHIFVLSIVLGCDSKKANQEYTYLEINRGNQIDTLKWELADDFITQTDSFYYISGIETYSNQKDSITIKLSKLKDFYVEYGNQLTDSLLFEFEDEHFKVYKYIAGKEIGDGIFFTYFEPSIGVLMIKSASWGTYSRLINTGNSDTDEKVFFLNERIIGNHEFFDTQ